MRKGVCVCVLFFVQHMRKFWQLRGFYDETMLDVVNVCYPTNAFSVSTVLLRAGKGYTAYQPATSERLST